MTTDSTTDSDTEINTEINSELSRAQLDELRTPQQMSAQLRGEVAIITGASSGIGASVARDLGALGMRVAVIARRAERLDRVVAQVREAGGEAWGYPLNLRDADAIEDTFKQICDELGAPRALINNAGLGHSAPLISGETAQWREMLEVNILGLCVCTREAIKYMRPSGDWGHVIHISSMSAHRVPEGSGIYSATKFAVRSLTESLRRELREAESYIRVTSISPGFVETEFAAHYHRSEERAREIYSAYPVLQPQDIANQVRFVLTQPPHVQLHDLLSRPTLQIN